MSTTFITFAVTGKHGAKGASNLLRSLRDRMQLGIIRVSHREESKTNSLQVIPHAFAQLDTNSACANDSLWNPGTLDSDKGTQHHRD